LGADEMKPTIVLDKCYLQGATSAEIRELFAGHTVLMPEALLLELLTTDERVRASCFRKFPEGWNPVDIITNVGTLLVYERENHAPATPIHERRLDIRFTFGPKLAAGTFVFTPEQRAAIAEWEANTARKVEDLKLRVPDTIAWLPSIASYRPGLPPVEINKLRQAVATDSEMIRDAYDMFFHAGFPPSSVINEEWACFRWVQVQLLTVLEYIRRYGAGNIDAAFCKAHNDVVDMEYTMTGVLAGALASRDGAVKEIFRMLCPSGKLVC